MNIQVLLLLLLLCYCIIVLIVVVAFVLTLVTIFVSVVISPLITNPLLSPPTEAAMALVHLKEQHRDIMVLEQNILELHQIFVDIATLIDAQVGEGRGEKGRKKENI